MTESTNEIKEICIDYENICPLCNSVIRFFYINLSQLVLICGNPICEYPFGFEDLQIINVLPVYEERSDPSLLDSPSNNDESKSPSETPNTVCSNTDKLNKVCNAEESPIVNNYVTPTNCKNSKKLDENRVNSNEIDKNVEDLKCLTTELNEMGEDTDECDVIKNKKWITKLMKLQGMSGIKLVKTQEMELLKQKPVLGCGEVKIDIDTNRNNISSINIQILP